MAAGAVSIADLESTNGTFVDGKRIAGIVELPQETVVRVGPFRLRWNFAVDVEGTMPPSPLSEHAGRGPR